MSEDGKQNAVIMGRGVLTEVRAHAVQQLVDCCHFLTPAVDAAVIPKHCISLHHVPRRHQGPKDRISISIRILHTMVSGIPPILGLRIRRLEPCVYVAFWAPKARRGSRFPNVFDPWPDV